MSHVNITFFGFKFSTVPVLLKSIIKSNQLETDRLKKTNLKFTIKERETNDR